MLWLGVATLWLLAGCAGQDQASTRAAADAGVPAYVVAPKGCAVVAGGGIGSAFADPKITRFWSEVNRQITDRLYELLTAAKYRSTKLIVAPEDTRNTERLVVQGMSSNRCSRLIQLSHTVNEDAAGKFFRFDVSVMHLEPSRTRASGAGGTNVVTVGEYSREYRYVRDARTFETFDTGKMAATVFADLQKSGALEPLR
jgi:hypothetical protein